jgi:hypothetical protein
VMSFPLMDDDIVTASLSVAAAAFVGGEAGGLFIADPVAVAELAEAALEVEGGPAGQFGVGVVFPDAVGAAYGVEVGDQGLALESKALGLKIPSKRRFLSLLERVQMLQNKIADYSCMKSTLI